MKNALVLAAALAGLAALAAPAAAQDGQQTADRDATTSRTELTFTDADQVRGDRNSPWGKRLHARLRGARHTLIRPRTAFVPELLTSVEKL